MDKPNPLFEAHMLLLKWGEESLSQEELEAEEMGSDATKDQYLSAVLNKVQRSKGTDCSD